jgi:anti-anti-sigma factor
MSCAKGETGMRITSERRNARAVLALSGTFGFSSRVEFKAAYDRHLAAPDVKEIHIDLRGVQAMDASAPGMLLVLRERGRAAGKRITIGNEQPLIKEALALIAFYD